MKPRTGAEKKLKRPPKPGTSGNMRIALFTHDTFGLGHVKRSLNIIHALAKKDPNAAILLITGCPALGALKDLPANADCVKIPTVVKTGKSDSHPPHLSLSARETTSLRSHIIKATVLAFRPDVFVVDNFPLGSWSELLPTLQALKSLPTKTVLGLRDVLDAPEVVQADWKRQNMYDVLDKYYDKILIYGLKNIFDAVKNYALDSKTAKKVKYCGYLTNTSPLNGKAADIRAQLGVTGPFVLASGGGGGDAYPLLSCFVDSMKHLKGVDSVVFTGPMMGKSDRAKLISKCKKVDSIILREFVPDLRPYVKAADVIVTMCGYNTAAEILAYKPQAIVVPRTWRYGEHANRNNTGQEMEQIIRARALGHFGFFHLLEAENLTAKNLSTKISEILKSPKKKMLKKINVRGVENAAEEIIKTVSI